LGVKNRSTNAFTLIEMMVVTGMLAILMGVAFSGIGQARAQERIAKANAEIRELMNAWLAYEAAYDVWPVKVNGDLDATEANLKELMDGNQDGTVYLNVPLVNGAFRDPWGTPYKFRVVYETEQSPVTEEFEAAVTFPNRDRYKD
jgi:prepilin-type N-terminal cleavage/methylation domain-containing protein